MAFLSKLVKTLFKVATRPDKSRAASQARKTTAPRRSAAERCLDEHMSWLSPRWAAARVEEAAGTTINFPAWYFEDSTERQHVKAQSLGLTLSPSASKGQFSDVLGLFEEPTEEALEKLAFFGVKLHGANRNESRVRHELALLDASQDSVQRWAERPASKVQQEFFRFVGAKVPAGLTATGADALIQSQLAQLPLADADAWAAFRDVVDEFDDTDFRECAGIRKPTLADLRSAFQTLRTGASAQSFPDADMVAEYLLSNKPTLARG
jgi:hypothetical protein